MEIIFKKDQTLTLLFFKGSQKVPDDAEEI